MSIPQDPVPGTSPADGAGARPTPATPVPPTGSRRVAPKWLGKKIGRFRLQALLGQGAVGRVFRAEDSILHRRVALKVISVHSDDGQINKHADQFLTEARAAAALEHPNVVQIYEAGESGTLCYIAMELLDGGNLKELVDAGGPMDPGRACLLVADAADALAAAHELGIVHRDVKPANLMLSRQGRCKVTDFGLATFADLDAVPRDKSAGTPLYAAPEVVRGTAADERSDIYSMAATLFFLLAGRPPFKGRTRAEVLRMHVEEPVPDLRAIRPGLPEPLVAAVERGMDKDPGQRFASATQFARVLRVQTISVAAQPGPAPVVTAPVETAAGASMLNLSGMTAVAGTSGSLGSSGRSGSSGQLTPGDLGTTADPSVGPPSPVASPVAYATPPATSPGPLWRSPAVLVTAGAAVVIALVSGVALLRPTGPRPTAGTVTPLAGPRVAPPVVTPPPSTPPVTPATPGPTAAKWPVAIPAADVEHLMRVANGNDPDRRDRRAAVTGTVSAVSAGASGTVMRVEFADGGFTAVYFDGGDLFARMGRRFGGKAGEGLAGKTVRVSGVVRSYKDAPEIVVSSPAQVAVTLAP